MSLKKSWSFLIIVWAHRFWEWVGGIETRKVGKLGYHLRNQKNFLPWRLGLRSDDE